MNCKTECWYVGGDLTGALYFLRVLVVSTATALLFKFQSGSTFLYRLTQPVL